MVLTDPDSRNDNPDSDVSGLEVITTIDNASALFTLIGGATAGPFDSGLLDFAEGLSKLSGLIQEIGFDNLNDPSKDSNPRDSAAFFDIKENGGQGGYRVGPVLDGGGISDLNSRSVKSKEDSIKYDIK